MAEILILVVLGIWGSLLFSAGYFLAARIKKRWIRAAIGVAVLGVFFTLPILDELKGQQEFEALCKSGGIYKILPNAEGKKFDLLYSSTDFKRLAGYARPVDEKTVTYSDAASGEVIATAKAYAAGGGWLVQKRIIALSSTSGPLFGREQCFPPDQEEARRQRITNRVLN